MGRWVGWGAALLGTLSGGACTLLFPFDSEPLDDRPRDTDEDADAGSPDPGSCGQVLATVALPGPAIGVEIVFDQILAAWEGGGVDLIDVVAPPEPDVRDTLALDHPTGGLDVSRCPRCVDDADGRSAVAAYVSDAEGLEVLSSQDGLHVVARLRAAEAPTDAAADRAGTHAVVSFEDGRISVVEVADVRPGLPEVVELSGAERVVPPPCNARRLAVLDTGVVAALLEGDGCAPALWLFSSDDPPGLPPVTVPLGEPAHDLAQTGDHGLLIAGGNAGLWHVELGDSSRPVVRTLPLPHEAVAVAALWTHALVAGGGALVIVDLSDPEGLSVVDEVALDGEPRALAATRTTAYVALGDDGLAIVDIGCFIAPEGPLWDGRGDVGGGEGEGEGEPSLGPTACEPAQVAVESIDGRTQCALGCRTVALGKSTWCTTDCTSDAQCMGAASFCERKEDYCVHGCQTDDQCHTLGLHRCDPVADYCI